MRKQYALYLDNGAITAVGGCPESAFEFQPGAGESIVEIHEPLTDLSHYVVNGEVTPKQPFQLTISKPQITANGTDEVIITGIPAGTTVQWPDGQIDEVTGGEVGFAVDLPGTYALTFAAVPYLDQEVTIEAVAAA